MPRSDRQKGFLRNGKSGPAEQDSFLASLREHGRVIEASDAGVALPAGVTHVLVKRPGSAPQLVEKRKSFL